MRTACIYELIMPLINKYCNTARYQGMPDKPLPLVGFCMALESGAGMMSHHMTSCYIVRIRLN